MTKGSITQEDPFAKLKLDSTQSGVTTLKFDQNPLEKTALPTMNQTNNVDQKLANNQNPLQQIKSLMANEGEVEQIRQMQQTQNNENYRPTPENMLAGQNNVNSQSIGSKLFTNNSNLPKLPELEKSVEGAVSLSALQETEESNDEGSHQFSKDLKDESSSQENNGNKKDF